MATHPSILPDSPIPGTSSILPIHLEVQEKHAILVEGDSGDVLLQAEVIWGAGSKVSEHEGFSDP